MAVIGTIRNRLGFVLVGFVGFALVVFVLEGLFSSNRSAFSGGANDVAKIGGESVSAQDFELRIQQNENLYKQQNKTESVDAAASDQIREQAWNQMLSEMILNKEYSKLGLTVSAEELFDMVQGKNIDPQVRQAFTDPKTGVFDQSRVMGFLKNLESADQAQRDQWLGFEKSLQEQRLSQKYATLVSGGLYVTKNEAKFDFEAQNKIAKIKYVLNNYTTVADNTVKVEQADLDAYYKEHQKEYNQEETTRRLEFVTFDVVPSVDDKKEAEAGINKLYEDFKNTKDDSAFVAVNSDGKFDNNLYKKGMLAPKLDSLMFNNAVGFVYGPYLDGDKYKIAKIAEVKSIPDSVKARHILLPMASPAEKEKVMARADSIKKAIKGGAKFADLALKYSSDKGSAVKGGDLGWFGDATMVKPFSSACFDGKKGDMPVVETQFGVHIIEILEQAKTSKRVKVAFVERKLSASNKTYQTLFANATQFASAANGADFEKTAVAKGLSKMTADVKESDRTLSGIESSRQVIQWAYKADKGESSKVFEAGNKYVVAKLTEIREKGILPLDVVKDQVEAAVKKEKKAEVLAEKMKTVTSLDVLAVNVKANVQSADYVTFASGGIAGVGREPQVVGSLFTLKPGQISKPVKGNMGVFVVQLDSLKEMPMPKDFKMEQQRLMSGLKQRTSYEAYKELKDKANIEDNRIRFF